MKACQDEEEENLVDGTIPQESDVLDALAPYNTSCDVMLSFPVQVASRLNALSSMVQTKERSRQRSLEWRRMRVSGGGALYTELHTNAACHSKQQPRCGFGHPNHECPFYVHRPGGKSSLHQTCDLRRRERFATVMTKVCPVSIDCVLAGTCGDFTYTNHNMPPIGVPVGLKCFDDSVDESSDDYSR